MTNETTLFAPNKNFEGIKKIDENGVEYWDARELMPLLGYIQWRAFEEVIGRAAKACMNSGQDVDNHFARSSKMVEIGSNTVREVRNYKLDRYACMFQKGYLSVVKCLIITKNFLRLQNRLV